MTSTLPDTEAFAASLRRPGQHPDASVRNVFEPHGELVIARAPGRLDVMGGIADYSGSLVLEWPLAEATHVALQRQRVPYLRIVSLAGEGRPGRALDVPLGVLAPDGAPAPYDVVRAWFVADPSRHWAAYVAGVFPVLMRERGARFPDGAAIVVSSAVPEGKGVSSSAALEVATMMAVAEAWPEATVGAAAGELATLCQAVENRVAGAPCGVMDQMVSLCGVDGALMALRCQPAAFEGTIPLPAWLDVWGIDSGIRHAVGGADYGTVRVGAFMGYRILAGLAGMPIEPDDRPGRVRIADDRWGGYLVNVGPETLASLAHRLPDEMTGAEFLARFGGTTDDVTTIEPERRYPVRVATSHPVHEHVRVETWAARLTGAVHRPVDVKRLGEELGGLMYASHDSYGACGLGSDGTDLLVELARAAGPARGVLGAKITGGGSGGTVAVLTRAGAGEAVHEIALTYTLRTGRRAQVFHGSSPGAAAYGTRRLGIERKDAS